MKIFYVYRSGNFNAKLNEYNQRGNKTMEKENFNEVLR